MIKEIATYDSEAYPEVLMWHTEDSKDVAH